MMQQQNNPSSPPQFTAIADALEAGKAERDTLRFSECAVPGKKGYEWGAVMSTSPRLVKLFCEIWNCRLEIATALRAKDKS